MKKIVLLLAVIVFSFSAYEVQAQNTYKKEKFSSEFDTRRDNMGYWMDGAKKGLVSYNPKIPLKPAKYNGSELNVKGVKTEDSPDVAVSDQNNVTQSENSVFIDPNDFNYILNSNNSTSWDGNSVGWMYGADYLQSDDGSLTFGGSVQGAGGNNSGDPTTAIDQNGRQYVGYISYDGGMGVSYSDDGSSWTAKTVSNSVNQDKNHMWVDNNLSSPNEGNLYTVWTDFSGSNNDNDIVFSRSTDNGNTWSAAINISAAVNSGSHDQGCVVQTGPNGEVYVTWVIYDTWPSDETAIGFAKSTDGGATFEPAVRIIENIKGIRVSETSKNHRVSSFPSMAVDNSGGSYDGNIYISWTNIGTPGVNTGQNRSVYIVNSTDGGTTWSTAVRINQGPFDDDREAYFPWITCDDETGTLAAVFYDDRNTGSYDCETFSAYSLDAGATWTDFVVSDVSFTPSPIPGLSDGYMGDYLGITSKGGKVYPCWTDNRGGVYMTYVSVYELNLNAEFAADETEICNGSAVTFTDVSAGVPTSWDWSFPGGSPDSFNGQNPPPITYSTIGFYTVTLTVYDGAEYNTEVKTDYINVKNVIADFSGTPIPVVVGNTVTFTDESSCTPTGWTWSFPGGVPNSYVGQTPPAIQYDVEGMYDVTHTVTNAAGTDTKTYEDYITVVSSDFLMTNGTITTCTGNFYDSGGPDYGYGNSENYLMTFYPATTGNMIRFDFIEFEVENNCDNLYIYDGEDISTPLIGTYSGSVVPGIVTANNTEGALTFNFTSDYIGYMDGWHAIVSCYAGTDPPVADFVASDVVPWPNNVVVFTDLSINFPTSWEWSFNPSTVSYVNGTGEFSQNPEVEFADLGFYSVTLTATNDNGTDTETKTDYIEVVEPSLCLDDDLYNTGCYSGDGLTSWNLESINVPVIECANGDPYNWYHNFTDMIHEFEAGGEYTLTAHGGGNNYLDVWIDINEDYYLDDDELIVDDFFFSEASVSYDIPITIPTYAPAGQYILRYRTNWDSPVEGSCDPYDYGNMCDFTAEIGESEFPVAEDLTGYVDGYDVSLAWTAPGAGGQTGFNIYRDGSVIDNTTDITYTDMDLALGFYEYCVTAVYTDGESYCSNTFPAAITDPLLGDCENFYGLTVGDLVAGQIGDPWITWSGGSEEDATVSDTYSYSPDNSFVVDNDVDLVRKLDDAPIVTGLHVYSHYMYVSAGHSGYFNVQTDPVPGTGWVVEVFFSDDGTGYVSVNETNIQDFTYSPDTWIFVEINFDMVNAEAEIRFDEATLTIWNNILSIGGINYYGGTEGGPPSTYYDNVCFLADGGWLITSIAEEAFEQAISIFPNPASDLINAKSDIKMTNVRVYNNTGKLVTNKHVNSKLYQLNTSKYVSGIYFFQIVTNEGVVFKRIIIQ